MENIIDKTIEYVKNFFEKDFSGHDFYHTLSFLKRILVDMIFIIH